MPPNATPFDDYMRFVFPQNGAPLDLGFWLSSYNQALESWMGVGNKMMKRAAELSEEIVNFSRGRVQADVEAWQAVSSCRTPTDFFECQRQFAQKAVSQYLGEANNIASSMLALMGEAAAPLHDEQRKA
jgi:hypothetical protein